MADFYNAKKNETKLNYVKKKKKNFQPQCERTK